MPPIDLPAPKEPKPTWKKRKEAEGSLSRTDAVKRIMEQIKAGVADALGVTLDPGPIDVLVKTNWVSTKDGKWLLPDDIDEEQSESVEVKVRFFPRQESSNG